MPEEVHDCVESLKDEGHDEESAWAICQAEQKAEEEGVEDPEAVRAVAAKQVTKEWSGTHPAEKTAEGRKHLLEQYGDYVSKTLAKLDEDRTTKFKAKLQSDENMHVLYKADDGRMLIWGPASVEMVDKENDRITTEALKDAMPQLMRRQRLSLEHSDQLVGDIKESHEFDSPKTVQVNGETIERSEFPTDVLKADEENVPHDGLYVAGEVWADTQQAQQTQKDIENGVIDSYSISGEAIESSTRVKDGELVDDIKSIDLSAVTLCEEGMNQKAKFATLAKSDNARDSLRELATTVFKEHMPDDEDESEGGVGEEDEAADNVSEAFSEDEEKALKSLFEDVVKSHLPDGELATKEDIRSKDELRETVKEFSETDKASDEADEEEMADPDDDGDADSLEVDDDDEEKAVDVDDSRIEAAAELVDKDPSELRAALADEKMTAEDLVDEVGEDDDPDGSENEVDPEDDMDTDEDEVDEMSAHDVSLDTLKSELPDDLYSKVAEYLTDPGEGDVKADDDDDDEMGDDEDDEAEKAADHGDMEKAAVGGSSGGLDDYMATVTASGVPEPDEETDLAKSFEGDAEVEESEGGNLADTFYEEQGNL